MSSPKHKTDMAQGLETPPLSRAGRKLADAIMEAAKFKPTADGKRVVRQYEVHGIAVTEWMDAERAAELGNA